MDNRELQLIPAKPGHFDEYLRIRSEPSNLHWLGYEQAPDPAGFRDWFENRLKDRHRHIFLLSGPEGIMGALHVDESAEGFAVGYSVREQFQGRGLASFMLREGIKQIQQHDPQASGKQVIAWISEQNIGSQKVARACGFVKSTESEMRRRFAVKETYHKYIFTLPDKHT